MGEHKRAIEYLDACIQLDPEFSYAWNNRGYSKIELGLLDEGLQDTLRSNELEKDNSYFYKNLGVYHLRKGNFPEAMNHLKKAQKLDPATTQLDRYMKEVEEAMGK